MRYLKPTKNVNIHIKNFSLEIADCTNYGLWAFKRYSNFQTPRPEVVNLRCFCYSVSWLVAFTLFQ